MGFLDKFKKKEKESGEEDEPMVEDIKLETMEKELEEELDNAEWAASKDKPVEEAKEEPKMAETKKKTADKTAAAKKPAAKKPAESKKSDNKVWHITKRNEDGMWQVKAEGATKATKLFKTKAEAEDYVKTLMSNNEGSRVVKHKKTGEFQNK